MVGAVNTEMFAVELMEQGTDISIGLMYFISSFILMDTTGGKILNNVTAEADINQLHTLADAKNRFFVFYKTAENG